MKTTILLFYLALTGPLLAQDTPFGDKAPASTKTVTPAKAAETQPAEAPAVKESADLDRLRRDYLQKRADALRPVTTWYQSQLEALQRKFVQSRDVDGSLLVRQELDALRDRSAQEGQDLQKAVVAATLAIKPSIEPVAVQTAIGGRAPAMSGRYQVTLWNEHNGFAKDSGTDLYRIEALRDQSTVWKSEDLKLDWSATNDPKATVEIPTQPLGIDQIKIFVVKWVGGGGGLSEVAVTLGGVDITGKCNVSVSDFSRWGNDGRFAATSLVDKITSSAKFSVGYWLLPSGTSGYVTIKLPSR